MFTKNSFFFVPLFIILIFALPSSIGSDVVGAGVADAAQATLLPPAQFTAVDVPIATSTPASTPEIVPAPKPVTAKTKAVSLQTTTHSTSASQATTDTRKHLVVPSIGVNAPIDPVGVNAAGQMAVPSGSTHDVGWYKNGTVPGQIGSAVIDAHVFAGFSELHNIAVGDSIYVDSPDGTQLRFVVQEIDDYPLADVPAQKLFGREDAARLNLITCAGQLTPDHSTYDHRLVVYAVLAQ